VATFSLVVVMAPFWAVLFAVVGFYALAVGALGVRWASDGLRRSRKRSLR